MDDADRANESSKKYLLVSFHLRGRPPKMKSVDVVPRKWVLPSKSKKKLQCYYPPPPYDKVQELVSTHSDYQQEWEVYNIEIHGQSKTYKKAELLLEEIKKHGNEYAFSTDTEADFADKAVRLSKEILKLDLKKMEQQIKEKMDPSSAMSSKSVNSQDAFERGLGMMDWPSLELTEENLYSPIILEQDITEQTSGQPQGAEVPDNTPKEPPQKKRKLEKQFCCNHPEQTKMVNLLISIREDIKRIDQRLSNIERGFEGNLDFVSADLSMPEKYQISIPISSIELLQHFEQQLLNNRQCLTDTLKVLKTLKTTKISMSASSILKKFITREVAMQYTASKQMSDKFVMKLNLPQFMGCLTETLVAAHNVTEKDAENAIGTALTHAKGWDGHRNVKKAHGAGKSNRTSSASGTGSSSDDGQLFNTGKTDNLTGIKDSWERMKARNSSLWDSHSGETSESE
ncbi:uncharacterized protein LOC107040143 [Diachasma alloeum]|uniref:uncharacterized protein LOC107040143 n=1 Tax=Diachasma alloeum TaxID=454923 RepID=UPI0007383716|nr:uncharacterized protein LOC107040143 [Diachasma alloeum]